MKKENQYTDEELDEEFEQDITTESNKKSFTKTVIEFLSIISTSIVAIMIIFTFVFRIVGVSGPSMMNTLNNGDWLVVSAYCQACYCSWWRYY